MLDTSLVLSKQFQKRKHNLVKLHRTYKYGILIYYYGDINKYLIILLYVIFMSVWKLYEIHLIEVYELN